MQGILGIDLEHADGRMCSSKGSEVPSPEDSRDGSYTVACRAKPNVVQERNSLEGRGARLLFAMSLEEAADNTKVMTNKITRVGFQGDTCAVAEPEDITSLLE